jgi:hypothetical protein
MKNPIWLRLFFLFVVFQALIVASALIEPTWISLVMPWPASPLNARFIGALYVMGIISALLSAFAKRYAAVRISLIEIGFVTGVLLLITIPHFGGFTSETFPYRWTIFYTIDPLVTLLIVWVLRSRDPAPLGRNPLWPLFLLYAMVLGVAGLALLLLPSVAVSLWPWPLPPILGQVYSIFFLTFALGGVLAMREPRWMGVWIYCAANFGMLFLIIIVSLYHRDRFGTGPATWVWFSSCVIGLIGFAVPLVQPPNQLARREAQR